MHLEDSSSDSTSSSAASDTEAEAEECILGRAGVAQSYEVEGPLWRHSITKMLHKAVGEAGEAKTKCGRRAGNAYMSCCRVRWHVGQGVQPALGAS